MFLKAWIWTLNMALVIHPLFHLGWILSCEKWGIPNLGVFYLHRGCYFLLENALSFLRQLLGQIYWRIRDYFPPKTTWWFLTYFVIFTLFPREISSNLWLMFFFKWVADISGCMEGFPSCIKKNRATKLQCNKNLPSRGLSYPVERHFWRRTSFSPGGIC